jgi:hypothetical protein
VRRQSGENILGASVELRSKTHFAAILREFARGGSAQTKTVDQWADAESLISRALREMPGHLRSHLGKPDIERMRIS